MSELKPCPFCGSSNIDDHGWASGDGRHGPACDDCGGTADSVMLWNARPLEDALTGQDGKQDEAIYLLRIYHHAWETDNRVPSHAYEAAYNLLGKSKK